MRILALETSGRGGSIALSVDDQVVQQSSIPPGGNTAKRLVPQIAAMLDAASWRPTDVELVAVAIGPGSFTGLRIGVTTAKTFAYAVGAEIIGVETLEVIAAEHVPTAARLEVAEDAYRDQVFAAAFTRDADGHLQRASETRLLDVETWVATLRPPCCVIGPALVKYETKIPLGLEIAPEERWHPAASTVGHLALEQFQAGRRDSVWQLAPLYLRPSAAEEKQQQQQQQQ